MCDHIYLYKKKQHKSLVLPICFRSFPIAIVKVLELAQHEYFKTKLFFKFHICPRDLMCVRPRFTKDFRVFPKSYRQNLMPCPAHNYGIGQSSRTQDHSNNPRSKFANAELRRCSQSGSSIKLSYIFVFLSAPMFPQKFSITAPMKGV